MLQNMFAVTSDDNILNELYAEIMLKIKINETQLILALRFMFE